MGAMCMSATRGEGQYASDCIAQVMFFTFSWRMLFVQLAGAATIHSLLMYEWMDSFAVRISLLADPVLILSILVILLTCTVMRALKQRQRIVASLNAFQASISTFYSIIAVNNPRNTREQHDAIVAIQQLFRLMRFYVKDVQDKMDNKLCSKQQDLIKRHMYRATHRLFLVAIRNRHRLQETSAAALTEQLSQMIIAFEDVCLLKDQCRMTPTRALGICCMYLEPFVLSPFFVQGIDSDNDWYIHALGDIIGSYGIAALFHWMFVSLITIEQTLCDPFVDDNAMMDVVFDWEDVESVIHIAHMEAENKPQRIVLGCI